MDFPRATSHISIICLPGQTYFAWNFGIKGLRILHGNLGRPASERNLTGFSARLETTAATKDLDLH